MVEADLQSKFEILKAQVDKLSAQVTLSADIRDINQLQSKYMYFLEAGYIKRVWEELFSRSENVRAEICDAGVWQGVESVKNLWMQMDKGATEMIHSRGIMHTLFIAPPYIVVGKDGKTAKGMWHVFGPHSMEVTPYPCDQRKLTAYWFFGKYDNEYIKENGEWKILSLHAVVYFRTPYDQGWIKQADARKTPPPPNAPPDKPYSLGDTLHHPDAINRYLPHLPESNF